jgi:hypothetical protein
MSLDHTLQSPHGPHQPEINRVVHLLRPIAVTAYPGSPATSKPDPPPANHGIRGLAWVLVLLAMSPTAYKHVYSQSCRCLTHSLSLTLHTTVRIPIPTTSIHRYSICTYIEHGLQAYSIPAQKAHTMLEQLS